MICHKDTTESHGFALLEVSLATVALLPIFLAAFVVIQSFGLTLRASEAIEFSLRRDQTSPYRVRAGESGLAGLELDRVEVDRSVEALVERIEALLAGEASELASDRYRIEATVGLVGIDRTSGRADLARIEERRRVTGTLAVGSADLERTDPRRAIATYAGAVTAGDAVSLLARETPGEGEAYYPLAVVLHVRVFRDVEPNSVRSIRAAIGLTPYVSASQIATVRTEVGL